MNKLKTIILAAGKGTRMKSDLSKVLHMIQGKPMISYAVDLAKSLKIKDIIVVVGHKDRLVKKYLGKGVKLVKQNRLMGTADAVMSARTRIGKLDGDVLILYADHPLFTKDTIEDLVKFHLKNRSDCSFLTAIVEQLKGYGRIRRDNYSRVQEIIEETDLIGHDHDIKEINLGAYCFRAKSLFTALSKVKLNEKKKEYYLTDIIGILVQEKAKVEALIIEDATQALGINSQEDLVKANQIMRFRTIQDFIAKGVSIIDPSTTHIDSSAIIGQDTVIYPFTVIEADVKIGKSCRIGPFCHIRPKSILLDEAEIGNFTELNRSKIGKNTIMKHFSYLGDAVVGNNVNIGAGTVTANYDGKDKYPTYIKDRAFIGSDTVLIAPVKVGKGSVTAAGSVVTKNKNVPDKTVVAGVPARILSRRRKNE